MVRKLYDSLLRYPIVRNSSSVFTQIVHKICVPDKLLSKFWAKSMKILLMKRTSSFTDNFQGFYVGF